MCNKLFFLMVIGFFILSCSSSQVNKDAAAGGDGTDTASAEGASGAGGEDVVVEEDKGGSDVAKADEAVENPEGEKAPDLAKDDELMAKAADQPASAAGAEAAPAAGETAMTDITELPPATGTEEKKDLSAPAPQDTIAAAIEPTPADTSAPLAMAPVAHSSGVIPKYKKKVKVVDGISLNTVYFARKGDTFKSVSQKIYGEDRAKELKKLNKHVRVAKNGQIRVGTPVYYPSPNRPADTSHVIAYVEDNKADYVQYKVKKGDTLSKISKAHYGNVWQWKEIYQVNDNIKDPDLIYKGQDLKLIPVEVSFLRGGANVASVAPGTPEQTPGAVPMPEDASRTVASVPSPAPAAVNTQPPQPEPAQVQPPVPVAAVTPPPPQPVTPPPPPPPPAPEQQQNIVPVAPDAGAAAASMDKQAQDKKAGKRKPASQKNNGIFSIALVALALGIVTLLVIRRRKRAVAK